LRVNLNPYTSIIAKMMRPAQAVDCCRWSDGVLLLPWTVRGYQVEQAVL